MIDRDTVIELARSAGFQVGTLSSGDGSRPWDYAQPMGNDCFHELTNFAQAVSQRTIRSITIAELALEIRRVDADRSMCPDDLAEAIAIFIRDRSIGGGES